MATHTVRLDDEAERLLAEIRRATGASVSQALKRGLELAACELREKSSVRPYAVFSELDIGEGGYAAAPARQAKRAIREVLRRRV